MLSITQPNNKCSVVTSVIAGLFLLGGCTEYVNPWRDDTVGPEVVTTASVEGTRAHQPESTPESEARVRDREQDVVATQDGTVGHFPLWWEDPFEVAGSEDGQLAWTEEDYFAMPYGLARFIANTMGMPVSAVVYPPEPKRGSDGVLHIGDWNEYHDPDWLPSGVSPTPVDILEIGSIPPESEAPVEEG